MDNLWNNKPLSYEDLRVASNAVNTWQNSYKFYEKLDLMVTGMIGWSCNFGFTKEGLKKHLEFMKNTYGDAELFDSKAFKGNWGYEDVAMGIDALFAGLNIWITNDIKIIHKAHERTDASILSCYNVSPYNECVLTTGHKTHVKCYAIAIRVLNHALSL